MELLGVSIVAALVFGGCFLVDKGFTRLFRSKTQHQSGLSVRLNRKYGAIGVILFVFGLSVFLSNAERSWQIIAAGAFLMAVGVALVVYYMTFGIFYDKDSFLLTSFGKKSTAYRYADIKTQQLYNSYGAILIELHMTDGRTVQLQATMTGVYPFLDKAFSAWCEQKGIRPEDCAFHDPANSCWFPAMEDK